MLFVGHAAGHGILTVPHSKNNGYPGSYALDRSAYYTTASWWLDRAYFGTPKVTPWMRPGHFSWADARDLADVSQTFHPCGCYNPHGVQFCAGVELAHGWGETSLGRDLHGSCGWPQGGATSVAVGKSTGNRFQSVCEPWRRLRLHAVQKDRFSAVPKGSQ